MDSTSWKVFLAVALGAGIGALIALDLGLSFLWLGAMVGGLIGYLTYEFKEVVHAIPQAWNSAINWRPSNEFKERFHYCTIRKPAAMLYVIAALSTAVTTFVIGVLLFLACLRFSAGTLTATTKRELITVSIIYGCLLCASAFSCIMTFAGTDVPSIKSFGRDTFRSNPIRVYCYLLPKYLFKAVAAAIPLLIKLVMNLPEIWRHSYPLAIRGTKAVGRFCYHLIFLIHSDLRTICMIDAAIFACIGYFMGSAIMGAISGGIFGVLNYKIVPKFMPGLVPRK